jgi:hypothetical protein
MLQFRGSAIAPDTGLLVSREFGDRLGLTDTCADIRTAHRLREWERRQPVLPRPGDALGGQ